MSLGPALCRFVAYYFSVMKLRTNRLQTTVLHQHWLLVESTVLCSLYFCHGFLMPHCEVHYIYHLKNLEQSRLDCTISYSWVAPGCTCSGHVPILYWTCRVKLWHELLLITFIILKTWDKVGWTASSAVEGWHLVAQSNIMRHAFSKWQHLVLRLAYES